jgi:hypothetical protein
MEDINMAKRKSSDYFGLGFLVSLILAIIPFTAWFCGVVTRIKEGKYVAGIIRIFGGWLIWLLDLVFMLKDKHIFRLLNI